MDSSFVGEGAESSYRIVLDSIRLDLYKLKMNLRMERSVAELVSTPGKKQA